MKKETILLDKFGDVCKHLAVSNQQIEINKPLDVIIRTGDGLFEKLKKDYPMLSEFLEKVEMSLVTSMVFNLALSSDIREDVFNFMKDFSNDTFVGGFYNGKPN